MSLHDAVQEEDIVLVKQLIGEGSDLDAFDEDGRTALWLAAEYGFVAIAKALLDANADVNKADDEGKTAIYEACMCRQVKCVQLLVAYKANVMAQDKWGNSSLLFAAQRGCRECLEVRDLSLSFFPFHHF